MERVENITWERAGSTGILTLGPPPENLLHEPEFVPLTVLEQWTSAPGLKALLIHGEGKHFSSGADTSRLFEMITAADDLITMMDSGKALLEHLESLEIPVVAAIRGVCFGGGLEVALACHIRICAENALFAFPEAAHNLIPGLGGTVRAPAMVGQANALKMILGGDMINAEEALQTGLVDRIVPKKDLLSHCLTLLEKMTADRTPEVIHAVMQSLHNTCNLTKTEAMKEETRLFYLLAKKESIRRTKEGA